jgi:hypothetical protein
MVLELMLLDFGGMRDTYHAQESGDFMQPAVNRQLPLYCS